jgi:hypothetical protein
MKVGDLVKVSFGYGDEVVGIFMGYDEYERDDEYEVWEPFPPTLAQVFWEGEIYSTPIDQIEVLNESR